MESSVINDEKICSDCKTSKTPMWRNGPFGPKSLCNACGIRFRKKKTIIETNNDTSKQPQSPTSSSSSSPTNIDNNNDCDGGLINKKKKGGEKLRIKLVSLGKEVVLLQRQRSPMKKVKRRQKMDFENFRCYGEVEQAAFLLMSLSCGSVFG